MKRFKHLLLIGAILNVVLALALPSTVSAVEVTVSIYVPAEVGPGTDFVARVNINNVTNFDACNYDVTYDPSVLEVTDITDGLIGSTNVPVGIWAEVASGKVRAIENIPGVSGVTGSGYLAEIHFHVIGTYGSASSIAFSGGTLSSGSATEIPASWDGDSVDVISSPAPAPTPTSTPTPTLTPTPTPCTASTPAHPELLSPLNWATGLAQATTMQWKASNGAQWYHLQISTVSSFTIKVLDVDQIHDTTYNIPAGTLNWNTRYYWRVSAGSCGGTSAWTPASYFTTALGPPPADPSGLAAAVISSTQINLTWTDNSNNETGFKIERRTGTGTYIQVVQVGVNVTAYNNTGLTANTTYYYRVRSYSAAGNSNYCSEVSAKTLPTPPSAPVLTSPAMGATGMNLTPQLVWNPSTGAANYSIQVSNVSTFATTVINQTGVATSFFDVAPGTLAWNTMYYWRVNAVGPSGSTSAWTPARYFTTALGPPPNDPSNLVAIAVSWSQTNLTWQDNSNNETGFKLERKTGAGGTYSQIGTVGANVNSYSDIGLTGNTTYYYRIRSYSAAGNSNYCIEASVTTLLSPPPVPALTSPANGGIGISQTPRLTWNPSTGAVIYSLQVSTVSTFATTVINQSGVANTYLDIPTGILSWNTRYYWRVNAVGTTGSTSAWTPASYFTTALGPPPEDPSGLAAAVISSTQINLTWTDNSNNETGFKIERRTGTGTYTQVFQVGVNVTAYNNTGLTANTTYYYRVRSYSAAGNSNYCSEVSAKTLPTPPSAPVLTSPGVWAAWVNLTPRLVWNPSTGAENYSIQVSNVSNFATTIINQTGVATSFFDVASGTLAWNTMYYWRVNAVGPSGSTSAWTKARYFITSSGSY